MENKKIKMWFMAFVFTLATAGGAASYAAKEQMFYKGTERVERAAIGQASVLDTPVIVSALPAGRQETQQSATAPEIVTNEGLTLNEPEQTKPSTQEATAASVTAQLKPIAKPAPSPCAADNTIVFKDGQFAGCKSACEAQGKHTYVGPDRPGLLYGRCIECDTATFLLNGGTCNFNS